MSNTSTYSSSKQYAVAVALIVTYADKLLKGVKMESQDGSLVAAPLTLQYSALVAVADL